jgi:hypothetical protein
MVSAPGDRPQVLHALPGRWRVRLPQPSRQPQALEQTLRGVRGVRQVQVSPWTGNALIHFDPETIDEASFWAVFRSEEPPASVIRRPIRLRLVLKGLDHDPDLGRRAVERLEQYPTVHARPNPLTGRILIEYTEGAVSPEKLRDEVNRLEPPPARKEKRPEHPLDLGPLAQSTIRTVAGALGLGYLVVRRVLRGRLTSPGAGIAEPVAGVVSIVQAFPVIQDPLHRWLGRDTTDLVLGVTDVVAQAIVGDPLGVALAGAQAVRLLATTCARRQSWRRYEELLAAAPPAYPGARISRASGERSLLDARILEGSGTALGRDGLPLLVAPGATVPAGARLFGGPFVLELQPAAPFSPDGERRSVPTSPYHWYAGLDTLLSLGYAAVAAVLTRSVSRTFEALVLVNPRTAVVGLEAANQAAAARAVRAGAIVVGSRPERAIRRPTVLLLDGPRTLVESWDVDHDRPRLAAGAADLARRCRENGVACLMLPGANRPAAEALSQQTGIALAEHDDASALIHERQQQPGAVVAFVSDSAHAAAAFDRCDLAIALTTDRDAPFPARADLLAPDLEVVAALVEAGTERDRAVRDAIGLAFVDDLLGLSRGARGLPPFGRTQTLGQLTGLAALADSWLRLRGGRNRPGERGR